MRKFAIGLLVLFRRISLFIRKLCGKTEDDVAGQRVVNETTKLGADNPDNFYQTAALNGNYEYKISGRRNTVAYLSFGTQSGNYGQGGGLVAGAPLLFAKWARNFQKHSNELPLFDPQVSLAAGGDPNITYYHSHWAIAEGEALLIEVTPPSADCVQFSHNEWFPICRHSS